MVSKNVVEDTHRVSFKLRCMPKQILVEGSVKHVFRFSPLGVEFDALFGRRLLEAAPQDHCVIIALFRAKTSHDVGRELHGLHFWLLGPSSRTGRRARLERVSSCFAADKASEGRGRD